MEALPIIFFHHGNPDYLKYSLKQAKHFNPEAPVYLLGDKSNDRYPFVKHVNISELASAAEAFTQIYKHRSPNSENYELNCFLRWFYIKAFCKREGIEGFIYLDSDVLLFEDLTKLKPFFGDSTIANTYHSLGMPAMSYFKNYEAISSFCDFLIYAYTNAAMTQKLEEYYKTLSLDPDGPGGISDMVLFHLYFLDHPAETLKIDLINNQLAVDVSINLGYGYEMEGGVKKVYWQNGLPYCKELATGKLVRFVSLHYQGTTKNLMRDHYVAGEYELAPLPLKDRLKQAVKSVFKK